MSNGKTLSPIVLQTVYSDRLCRLLQLLERSRAGVAFTDGLPDGFLEKLFVVLPSGIPIPPVQEASLSQLSQSELVNRAIERLVGTTAAHLQTKPNVLALGYRLPRDQGSLAVAGTTALENFFPNTLVNHVRGPAWENLLTKIGPAFMFFLITECEVFSELPNGCYFQVAGFPITEALGNGPAPEVSGLAWLVASKEAGELPHKRKAGEQPDGSVPERKRRKHPRKIERVFDTADKGDAAKTARANAVTEPKAAFRRTPSALLFGRSNMLYARATQGHKGSVWVGLPRHHIMNKSKAGTQTSVDVICRIFPRHLSADNVFTSKSMDPKQANFLAWGMPSESRMGKGDQIKSSKTLKAFVPLWDKVLRRHHRTNYRALLDFHCPASPVESLGTANLIELASPLGRVIGFVRSIVHRVFPLDVWGSRSNERAVLSVIERFIRLGRFETMSLHDFLQCVKTEHVAWACPGKGSFVSHAMQRIRYDLLCEWMWWLVEGFVIPLLRTCFYITESSSNKNQLLFFRQDQWQSLLSHNLAKLQRTLVRVAHDQVLKTVVERPLAFSYVRLLPKETGIRPIVNLRRRFSKNEIISAFRKKRDNIPAKSLKLLESKLPTVGTSINQALAKAFQVLTFEKSRSVDSCAGAVLGLTDIYAKIKEFRGRIMDPLGRLPSLFIAKVDVTQAFDTIEQELLIDIVRDLAQEDEYVVQKYAVLFPSAGRIRRSFVKKARPADDFAQFPEQSREMSGSMRNAVFMDQVVHNFEDRDDILYLIEEHILNNLVKIGNKFYRQATGIPQGSVLSTLLCNFFYADLVRRELKFTLTPDGLLMRFVDDFIYITIDRTKATRFVTQMHGGYPKYGCQVNPAKTLVNFDLEIGGMPMPKLGQGGTGSLPTEFPWCGHLIDSVTLDFHADYTRYFGTDIKETITQETSKRSGTMLLTKLVQFLKPRCHALYLDTSLNSSESVRRNIFENFTLTAMKLVAYLRKIAHPEPRFLFRAINSAIRFGVVLTRSRTANAAARGSNCTFGIAAGEVEWLGWKAFSHVFARKQARYSEVLGWLEEKAYSSDLCSKVSVAGEKVARNPIFDRIQF